MFVLCTEFASILAHSVKFLEESRKLVSNFRMERGVTEEWIYEFGANRETDVKKNDGKTHTFPFLR